MTNDAAIELIEKARRDLLYLESGANYREFAETVSEILNQVTQGRIYAPRLTDESVLFWGKYEGRKLKDIPAEYLLELLEKDDYPYGFKYDLKQYTIARKDALEAKRDIKANKVPFEPNCKKKYYATKSIAKAHLKVIAGMDWKKFQEKKPVRAYECDKCGFWHLTAMKHFNPEKTKSPAL